jgi:sugar lactone lactonase YvrE
MKTSPILRNPLFVLAGLVAAFLPLAAHAQNLYVSFNGPFTKTGGSISEYTPDGMQTILVPSLSQARGLAFDSRGNLFAASTYHLGDNQVARILKLPPRGSGRLLGEIALQFAQGMVADVAGNVFVVGQDQISPFAGTIYKFAPNKTQSVFGSTAGQTFALALDSSGNLFAADSFDQTVYEFTPDGTRSVFAGPDAFAEGMNPVGLAFDSFGNLFVATEGAPGNDTILEFTPTGMVTTFATGLTTPRGLAFDDLGNLFVAETRPAPDGDILEFTPEGSGTVFASGLDRPEYLAFGPPR